MEIKGYKVFIGNKELFTNNYNRVCKEGEILEIDGELQVKKNGYHFAKRLEDTFRYGNSLNEGVVVCEVTSLGDILEYDDEYYGYYDLYVSSKLRIDKILSRKDIIEYMDKVNVERLKRFVQTFKLTYDEAMYFIGRNNELDKYIEYYQFGNKDAFSVSSMKR